MNFLFAPLLVLAASGAVTGAAGPAEYRLVDRVLATVARDVITLSDLEWQSSILIVIKTGPNDFSAIQNQQFLDSVLETLINQQILIQEMKKEGFWIFGTADKISGQLLESFKARFSGEQQYGFFLASTGMSEEMLTEFLTKTQLVEDYLEKKSRAGIEISDDEIAAFCANNSAFFSVQACRENKKQITDILIRQRSENQAREILTDLRAKYVVQIVALPQ